MPPIGRIFGFVRTPKVQFFSAFEMDELTLAAVGAHGEAVQRASAVLKKVFLEAVAQDGRALQYAPKGLQADKEVVFVAVTEDVLLLYF